MYKMSPVSITLVVLGMIVFLIGYWFLGKSTGEKECPTPIESYGINHGGGIAGLVLGIILMLIGIVYTFPITTNNE